MSYVVEVDQSGKVEDTKEDSVLAMSNGKTFSVCISASIKRTCIRELRNKMPPQKMYLQMFTVGLYFLLRDYSHTLTRVHIDQEYQGKNDAIKEHLVNLLLRNGYFVDPRAIQFTLVGKHSPAHTVAWGTLRKHKKPNKVVQLDEFMQEFRPKKKIGDPVRGKCKVR
ncbi:hypothetical protein HGA88_02885 [Candidatus Roizmanbacteria bacterium]|nr:hypothetical protein [Candidatus Roizmanbacteria bacterium]